MLEVLQAITGVFALVYDGQHGLRFTLGRAKEIVGPGIHWKWPILQKFRIEETKHTTLDLEPQTIQLADDLVYEIDCKVVYQIVNLRKALINIDDLVQGLQNRVVIAVQRVLRAKNRLSIRDTDTIVTEIHAELRPVEEEWGVRILQLGFSNISPSPATLEITQLELLAREKLALYRELLDAGLTSESAVALISGAVISLTAGDESNREDQSLKGERLEVLQRRVAEAEEAKKAEKADKDDPLADILEDEEDDES